MREHIVGAPAELPNVPPDAIGRGATDFPCDTGFRLGTSLFSDIASVLASVRGHDTVADKRKYKDVVTKVARVLASAGWQDVIEWLFDEPHKTFYKEVYAQLTNVMHGDAPIETLLLLAETGLVPSPFSRLGAPTLEVLRAAKLLQGNGTTADGQAPERVLRFAYAIDEPLRRIGGMGEIMEFGLVSLVLVEYVMGMNVQAIQEYADLLAPSTEVGK
jgi:hypothetical protein